LAELAEMAEARLDDEWNHTSAILALLANIHRDPKKHGPYRPEHFHPFKRKASVGVRITRENIGLLKKAFIGRERQS
jgi:hypothetical protein